MQHITANIPSTACPSWAVWQRQLIKSMNESVYPYLEHFTEEDGEFIWKDEWGGGSADDYYEPFFNWSTLYAMGGGEHLLQLADRQWDAVTKQLTRLGTIHKEYGIDSDNMHQAEQDICFYNLCLADPQSTKLRERAQRFAGFYLNEDPDAINYDPEHKLVLSMRNGSKGAYYPPLEERETASYNPLGGSMETYNLPFFDLPGIDKVEDLADPENARRMGQALFDRWHKGDTPINLSITSLMTNAFLMTGEEKYRSWVVEYTNAWMQRARDNNGIMPDQIGHSGKVGEYVDGKWYGGGGGGWTFPHGFLTIQFATLDAGINAYLLTRDAGYLELPRRQQERIMELGEMRDPAEQYMSVSERWDAQFASLSPGEKTLLFPYRYGDAGWFDWMPMSSVYPSTLWYYSMADEDWQSVERVRAGDAHDWSDVYPFHNKEDSAHEQPWLRYLAGDNPTYPERTLEASHQIVARRLALVREDEDVGTRHHITSGNGAIRSLPRPSFRRLLAGRSRSTTADSCTPASATSTHCANVPDCPRMSVLWSKNWRRTALSSGSSTSVRLRAASSSCRLVLSASTVLVPLRTRRARVSGLESSEATLAPTLHRRCRRKLAASM